MDNIIVDNILITGGKTPFISTNVGSSVNFIHSVYRTSVGPLIQLTGSSLNLNNLTISQIESEISILTFHSATDTSIDGLILENITGGLDNLIIIQFSKLTLFSNLLMKNMNYGGMYINYAVISEINNINLANLEHGIEILHSDITLFKNSTFKNLGSASFKYGGGIYTSDSNIVFENNTFDSNIAVKGGAIYIS